MKLQRPTRLQNVLEAARQATHRLCMAKVPERRGPDRQASYRFVIISQMIWRSGRMLCTALHVCFAAARYLRIRLHSGIAYLHDTNVPSGPISNLRWTPTQHKNRRSRKCCPMA